MEHWITNIFQLFCYVIRTGNKSIMGHNSCWIKAKIQYTSFPVASPQQVSNFPVYREAIRRNVSNGFWTLHTLLPLWMLLGRNSTVWRYVEMPLNSWTADEYEHRRTPAYCKRLPVADRRSVIADCY